MNVTVTAWPTMAASKIGSGLGQKLEAPLQAFAEGLIEEASEVYPKGAGPCFAFAESSDGGSGDDQILAVTGLLLDSDNEADFEKIDAVEAALRSMGQAYVISRRGRKAHVLLPFAERVYPPHSPAAEKAHKRARIEWIRTFGAAFGIEFDPSPGKRYAGLIFFHTRREESEAAPSVSWADGSGLDFTAYLASAGAAPPSAPDVRAPVAAPAPEDERTLSPAETIEAIRKRALRSNLDPKDERTRDVTRRILLLLQGDSWAGPTDRRDEVAQSVTTWIALYTDSRGDIEAIMEAAAPSLEKMAEEQPSGFGDGIEEKFFAKLTRNFEQTRANAVSAREREAAVLATLSGARKAEVSEHTRGLFSKQ